MENKNIPADQRQYGVVLNFLKGLKGKLKLVEIGPGDRLLKNLVPKNISYSSIGIDKNNDFIVNLDKDKIPSKAKDFDILVCLETLEHIIDPESALEEFKRITKKEGIFVLSMPNDYNFLLRFYYLFGKKSYCMDKPFKIVVEHRHIHKPRVKDILELFSKHFKIRRVVYLWQSQASNKPGSSIKWLARIADRIIDVLAKIKPSLFARTVIVLATKK